jgi:membrane-bound metal-dependent hydrolase YbcI (DUF457 family)
MYAVGHFALGYLTGKLVAKPLKVNINLGLLFLASILPDIDILVPGLEHRGPLHSVIIFCILFTPIFLLYKKRAVPYFVAVMQHLLIGDFLTGGLQLLWPASVSMYGVGNGLETLSNITFELVLFLVSIVVMFKTKDVYSLFKHRPSNMILSIFLCAVLLRTVIGFPLYVSLVPLILHVFYMVLFSLSILNDLKQILTKNEDTVYAFNNSY